MNPKLFSLPNTSNAAVTADMQPPQSANTAYAKGLIQFSLLNAQLFTAKMADYDGSNIAAALAIIRITPGALFDWEGLHWTFPIHMHDPLRVAFAANAFIVEPLPRTVLSALQLKIQNSTTGIHKEPGDASQSLTYCSSVESLPQSLTCHLAPFQLVAADFVARNRGRAMIADDMGLGKTRSALCAAAVFMDDWPVLVVCPSSARFHWRAEALLLFARAETTSEEKASSSSSSISVSNMYVEADSILLIESLSHARDRYDEKADKFDVSGVKLVIVSYNMVSQMAPFFQQSFPFNVMIADECHYLKNSRTARTKILLPLLQRSRRAVLLSGTPALSRPLELFSQLNALAPQQWPDEKAFAKRYCRDAAAGLKKRRYNGIGAAKKPSHFGQEFRGASNTSELHCLLKQTVMIRRLKKDILRDIPQKKRFVVAVDVVDPAKKTLLRSIVEEIIRFDEIRKQHLNGEKKRRKTLLNKEEFVDDFIIPVAGAGLKGSLRYAVVDAKIDDVDDDGDKRVAKKALLLDLYKKSGDAKVEGFCVHVERFLKDPLSGKLIVFAHHKSVQTEISAFLERKYGYVENDQYIRLHGSVGGRDRHDRVAVFQSSSRCRVAVLSITSAGVGITLTAASTIFFAELYWNPGSILQAEDRAHRIGQLAELQIHYFSACGSVDDFLWPILQKKMKMIGESIDGFQTKLFPTWDHTVESSSSEEERRGENSVSSSSSSPQLVSGDSNLAGDSGGNSMRLLSSCSEEVGADAIFGQEYKDSVDHEILDIKVNIDISSDSVMAMCGNDDCHPVNCRYIGSLKDDAATASAKTAHNFSDVDVGEQEEEQEEDEPTNDLDDEEARFKQDLGDYLAESEKAEGDAEVELALPDPLARLYMSQARPAAGRVGRPGQETKTEYNGNKNSHNNRSSSSCAISSGSSSVGHGYDASMVIIDESPSKVKINHRRLAGIASHAATARGTTSRTSEAATTIDLSLDDGKDGERGELQPVPVCHPTYPATAAVIPALPTSSNYVDLVDIDD